MEIYFFILPIVNDNLDQLLHVLETRPRHQTCQKSNQNTAPHLKYDRGIYVYMFAKSYAFSL